MGQVIDNHLTGKKAFMPHFEQKRCYSQERENKDGEFQQSHSNLLSHSTSARSQAGSVICQATQHHSLVGLPDKNLGIPEVADGRLAVFILLGGHANDGHSAIPIRVNLKLIDYSAAVGVGRDIFQNVCRSCLTPLARTIVKSLTRSGSRTA
jgi:hypothetical protein